VRLKKPAPSAAGNKRSVGDGEERNVDWDKLRIFQAAADAGSFTHAGEALGLSQSAVSRQVSALEQDLDVPLFHRHARGLILTEQGEMLLRTVRDVMLKLSAVRTRLSDSRDKPHGELRVTTTVGIGTNWLTPRLGEFLELYPEIQLKLILSDDELDLGMREADVALRMREPVQPDLIRRRLFTMHFHTYASADYLKRHGQPRTLDDLDSHRILAFNGDSPNAFASISALPTIGRDAKKPRATAMSVNNMTALLRAVEASVGIAILPDYLIQENSGLVRLLPQADMPELDCYLVYPEEMKTVARVQVFRDFLVSKAQRWQF
jgi:DNA-binding transcriptional LysR family regulator